jgi:hypothetical protein
MSGTPRAHSYRLMAIHLWETAVRVSERDIQRQFEQIAKQYEMLADSVEKEATRRMTGAWPSG